MGTVVPFDDPREEGVVEIHPRAQAAYAKAED